MIIEVWNLILVCPTRDAALLLTLMTNVWWGKTGKANFGEGTDLLLVNPTEN